jgi:ABC-type transport system involved in multi-copper enzyme maturation permease subunit
VLRPRFFGAARGEAIKLTRQLSLWLMLGGSVLLLGVIVVAISGADSFKPLLASDPTRWAYDKLLTFGTVFQIGSGIFLLIFGARLFGMEYSYGTIRIIYARGTGRLQLLLAKTLALALIGLLLMAGYLVLVCGILLLLVNTLHGNLDPLPQISSTFWQDVGRWAVVMCISMGLAILMGAAAAGIGRSLAFALAAALAFYPVDNFLNILEVLGARATGHVHPWFDISAYQLSANLNVVLTYWEPGHQSRPAFSAPLVSVDLTHTLVLVGAYAMLFAAIAVFRAVRPDVLE